MYGIYLYYHVNLSLTELVIVVVGLLVCLQWVLSDIMIGDMSITRAIFLQGIQLTRQNKLKVMRTWQNMVILVNLCRILHKLINLCQILHKLPLEG